MSNHNIKQNQMSNENYISDTLEMPNQMPLFNYSLDFKGLRLLIEEIQVKTNTNIQQLKVIDESLLRKLPVSDFDDLQKRFNNTLRLGLNSTKLAQAIYQQDQKGHSQQLNRKELYQLQPIDQYSEKMKQLTNVLQNLVNEVDYLRQKVKQDDKRTEKLVDQSFRRIQEKVDVSLNSMNKNINLYFTQTNKKLVDLSSQVNENQSSNKNSFQNLQNQIHNKISDNQLKTAIQGIQNKIKGEIEGQINDDSMKRMASINDYSSKLKEHIKDTELKIKGMKNNVKQLAEKTSKCMLIKSFEMEKHKIFEKLSDHKTKLDELSRKNNEFVDFRKVTLQNNEKTRQGILGVQDDIKRLKDNNSNFGKMEDIGKTLSSLDPHAICQLSSEVKLHEKQIGKLEKQLIYLENELEQAKNSTSQMPEVNNGKNSDEIIKIIKEYMSNLDFEGRLKRSEKQLHDLSKKSDGINDLEKKVYMLGKQMDVGGLMKEIRKKSDDETTRREIRIVDSKIQKLFDFYKQLRKDLDENGKRSRVIKQLDSVSLTTKKLHPPNCLSCTPKPKSQRHYSRPKFDMSLDQSIDHIKNAMYPKY